MSCTHSLVCLFPALPTTPHHAHLFTDAKLVPLSTYREFVYLQNQSDLIALVDRTLASLHGIVIRWCGWVCFKQMHTDNIYKSIKNDRKKEQTVNAFEPEYGVGMENRQHQAYITSNELNEHRNTYILWNETVVWLHTPSARQTDKSHALCEHKGDEFISSEYFWHFRYFLSVVYFFSVSSYFTCFIFSFAGGEY